MSKKKIAVFVIAALAAIVLLIGCAPPPKIMTGQYFRYDKDIEYLIQRSDSKVDQQLLGAAASGSQEGLFHFFARVCDINQAGQRVNCKDTLVLPYVYPSSIY